MSATITAAFALPILVYPALRLGLRSIAHAQPAQVQTPGAAAASLAYLSQHEWPMPRSMDSSLLS
jgi:hypothetical protein